MSQRPRRYWMMRGGALLLLLFLYAQLVGAATQLSATVDEGFHITSGYEYLRTGSLRLFDEHAPVAKALFAWPLFFVPDQPPPETAVGYASGDLIAVTQATTLAYRPLDRVIVAPRLAAALLTLILAVTVYRCTVSFAGPVAGLLALFLCAFDPNFLAHGSLATTDMGATAFSFWAVWAGVRWMQQPTRRRWSVAALLLGLAQGAKLTALLLYPVLGLGVLLVVVAQWRGGATFSAIWKSRLHRDGRPGNGLALLWAFAGLVALSLLVLWALYGFELRPVPGVLGGAVSLPAASHIERWLRLQDNLVYGREAFLLGQNAMHGWPQYFPVAFLVKTPLPLLLLFFATLFYGVCRILKVPSRAAGLTNHLSRIAFFFFPFIYALASLVSSLNIGYRHLLPVLPFLYVGVASIASRITNYESRMTNYVFRFSSAFLLVWLAAGTWCVAPHYLAFFNEIAGGADHGWRYLADSNTDWGQAYKELARFQQERGLGTVRLSAFAFYDPVAYGVDYTALTPLGGDTPAIFPARFNPPPGDYVISATTLDGIPLADPEMYDWFRKRKPDARIGHVLFYYHIPPPADPGDWLAQCVVPVAPLPVEAAIEGLNRPELQMRYFDCTRTWIYPAGGESAGWYVHYRDGEAVNAFARLQLTSARLSYEQRIPRNLPPFTLYEWAPQSLSALLQTVNTDFVAFLPEGEQPAAAEFANALPLTLEGPLMFLGYRFEEVPPDGQFPALWTYWRVTANNVRPFSIMAHVLNAAGQLQATGDALGVAPDALITEDLLVQRHVFLPETQLDEEVHWFQIGVYWLDTMGRWPVVVADGTRVTQWLLNPQN